MTHLTHADRRVCVCVFGFSVLKRVFASDCPQVQCVEQYDAEQADELSLEPAEIVNVIRKTNEGKNANEHSALILQFNSLIFLLPHLREQHNLPSFALLPLTSLFPGWYEGSRLSDGQKGWFPVANVIEITNEHVRRRNLLERYRVSQAASFLSKAR